MNNSLIQIEQNAKLQEALSAINNSNHRKTSGGLRKLSEGSWSFDYIFDQAFEEVISKAKKPIVNELVSKMSHQEGPPCKSALEWLTTYLIGIKGKWNYDHKRLAARISMYGNGLSTKMKNYEADAEMIECIEYTNKIFGSL